MISLGGQAPHVLKARTGHACGEPNEIEMTAAHGLFNQLPVNNNGLFTARLIMKVRGTA